MKKSRFLIILLSITSLIVSCKKSSSSDPAPTNPTTVDPGTGVVKDDGQYYSTRTSYLYAGTDSLTLQNVPLYYNTTVKAFKPSIVVGFLFFVFPDTKTEFENFIKDSVNVNIINKNVKPNNLKNGSVLYDDNQHKTLTLNSIIVKVSKIDDLNYIVEGRSTNDLTNPSDNTIKFTSKLHYRIKITLK